ncbi:MAG: 1-deoxy-D-xylulose-5-phosphate synthase [Desulfuromonadaceae bacterium]
MTDFLSHIESPDDLKQLSIAELEQVAAQLRQTIIDTVSCTGGHLASSLGTVELSVALHYVLNSPADKIIWDVGHQAYAHKLLTGRRERFSTLRQLHGISGFPKRSESPHDCFDVGHSSTSISAATGMAIARDAQHKNHKIAAVIGDGSLTAGLAFEALNHAGHLDRNMIIILNDNEMSISNNVGALSSFLSRKMTSRLFVRFKRETENFLNSVPHFGKDLLQLAKRTEDSFKAFVTPGMLFEAFGIDYVGPIDGHELEEVIETLQHVKDLQGPVLVHVITKKGRGFTPAEDNPSQYHGVGVFDRETGKVRVNGGSAPSFTSVFGDYLCEIARYDKRITAITAAMSSGTGLNKFAKQYPERFFDVGIAEQHAVTCAAGMAADGLRPVVAIYSTFMQRAYDNVLHDVCMQNLPVTFALDRGGLVGADGPTHHGVFDFCFMRHIPNLTMVAPRNEIELKRAMLSASGSTGPYAYRYPRGAGMNLEEPESITPFNPASAELMRPGTDATIIALGPCVYTALDAASALAAENYSIGVVDARFLKPLDRETIAACAQNSGTIITLEENVLAGGFGSAVMEVLEQRDIVTAVKRIGLPDMFVEQGTQDELRQMYGLDLEGVTDTVRNFLTTIHAHKNRNSNGK